MGLKETLISDINGIFAPAFDPPRKGTVVPAAKDIGLGNVAVELQATILYADMAQSTQLVDSEEWYMAAKIYKSYLHCATKIIISQQGTIASFDGDRVMGIFIGDKKEIRAARAALKINGAVDNIINPRLCQRYPKTKYKVNHSVGIDSSVIRAVRAGIRNNNDIVWVGRAANHAAKLCGLRKSTDRYKLFISKVVYKALDASVAVDSLKKPVWVPTKTLSYGEVYKSLHSIAQI